MGTTFFKHRANFLKIHTDGFYSSVPLPIKCGTKMGDFVCKYSPHIEIVSNAKPDGEWSDFENSAK